MEHKYYKFELFGNARINKIIRLILLVVIIITIFKITGKNSYYKQFLDLCNGAEKIDNLSLLDKSIYVESKDNDYYYRDDFIKGKIYKGKLSGENYYVREDGELIIWIDKEQTKVADESMLARDFGIRIENGFGVCFLYNGRVYIYKLEDTKYKEMPLIFDISCILRR